MSNPVVKLSHISHSFIKDGREHQVLRDVSLSFMSGSRTILYGPSGAGKSTLLRIIAGLIRPDQGEVQLAASSVSMVFQRDMLFNELSALENIMYGLDASRVPKKEREVRARKWADVFMCADVLAQKTATLSGGQRQRVSLARAFMKEPDLLLMDESFQGLDPVLKERLGSEILALQEKEGFSLIFVTHSFEEAVRMGERLILMQDGTVTQKGSVQEVSSHPDSLFSASSLGFMRMNLLPMAYKEDSDPSEPSYPLQGWIGFYPWQAEPVLRTCAGDQETRMNGKFLFIKADFISQQEMGPVSMASALWEGTSLDILIDQDQKLMSGCGLLRISRDRLVFFDQDGIRMEQPPASWNLKALGDKDRGI